MWPHYLGVEGIRYEVVIVPEWVESNDTGVDLPVFRFRDCQHGTGTPPQVPCRDRTIPTASK